ncbi:MAG: LLM class F420-dependent oxidoreductase [Proteobacteria bacterium]|nr:LLM class F420-dependent oxidoreductase [Pseudomonadota bacterium]
MKLGAVFPQTEIGSDPAIVRDFAQTVEEVGYDHLLVYDHVLGATHDREPKLTGPYHEGSMFHEPFVLFGFLAAATSSLELVTGVLILPQRQTALVAKQAAEVDVLSGGRLRLGIGVGWNYVEYDALNEDFGDRGRRQEEQVEVLRRLWTEPVVDYRGEHHRIDRAGILPLPDRSIPVWFGGFAPVAYRRSAKIGDGFIFGGNASVAGKALEETRGYLREAGRDDSGFGAEMILMTRSLDDSEKFVSEARAWREAGGTHMSLVTMDCGLADPQQHLDALQRLKRALDDSGALE